MGLNLSSGLMRALTEFTGLLPPICTPRSVSSSKISGTMLRLPVCQYTSYDISCDLCMRTTLVTISDVKRIPLYRTEKHTRGLYLTG